MTRLGYEPIIQHFSHPHPLDLTSSQHSLAPLCCAGCNLRATGWAYSCTPCGYHLHTSCSQMPQLIHHPADPHHALRLLTVPAYPEGSFNCDACGCPGTGFSYHCSSCGLDVHTLCASMPLSVSHHVHAHPLSLAFSPSYENHGFSCDICGSLGANHWLYRCALCEFDAHLGWATARSGQRQQQQAPQLRSTMGVGGRIWQGNGAVGGPQPQGMNRVGSGGTGSLTNQAINGFVNSAAQQMGQSLIQNMFGVGGGGGDGGGGVGAEDGSGGLDGSGGGGEDGTSSVLNMGSATLRGVLGRSDSSSGGNG